MFLKILVSVFVLLVSVASFAQSAAREKIISDKASDGNKDCFSGFLRTTQGESGVTLTATVASAKEIIPNIKSLTIPTSDDKNPLSFTTYMEDSNTDDRANLMISDPKSTAGFKFVFGSEYVVAKYIQTHSSMRMSQIEFYTPPQDIGKQLAAGKNPKVDYSKFQKAGVVLLLPEHCDKTDGKSGS